MAAMHPVFAPSFVERVGVDTWGTCRVDPTRRVDPSHKHGDTPLQGAAIVRGVLQINRPRSDVLGSRNCDSNAPALSARPYGRGAELPIVSRKHRA